MSRKAQVKLVEDYVLEDIFVIKKLVYDKNPACPSAQKPILMLDIPTDMIRFILKRSIKSTVI
jgi:hypothetical protein